MSKEKTKKNIADSFVQLLEKKPFDKISISEIVDNCGLSRQAFYNSFTDKYDLLEWIIATMTNEIMDLFDEEKDVYSMVKRKLENFRKNSKFLVNVLDNDEYHVFFSAYAQQSINILRNLVGNKNMNRELEVAIDMFSYGYCQIVMNWMHTDMEESPEQLAKYIINSMPKILKGYYFVIE